MIRVGRVEDEPYFLPWISDNLAQHLGKQIDGLANGTPIHVMGESHYTCHGQNSYERTPELTRQVVREWAFETSSGSAFFTRVGAAVANEAPGTFDREAVWNSFAFSNFSQDLLSGPRQPLTRDQCERGRKSFFGQLNITRPEVLAVLGNSAWNSIPTDVGVKLPEFKFEVEANWPAVKDAWFYPYATKDQVNGVVAVKIVHPSAGGGHWNWKVAAQRIHTARYCHSSILEWVKDNYLLR